MAEAESEEADRLRNKFSEMSKSASSIVLPSELKSTWQQHDRFPPDLLPPDLLITGEGLLKGEELLKKVPSGEHKSSYFHTKSLEEMDNEDPIRLLNQSCVILKDFVKTQNHEQLVYSSSARLPTYSIGLSSTQAEVLHLAPVRESSVDPEDNSLHRYFQMPELGARVFVGDGNGFDTVTCHLFDGSYRASESQLDSKYLAVRSLYENNRPGGLSGWLQAQPEEFWKNSHYLEVILSGTELFVAPRSPGWGASTVGNLRGKSSRVSGSSTDHKDCTGDKSIRQPSDIVEQPGDPVPGVQSHWGVHWESVEGPLLWRSTKGSYFEKPKFTNIGDPDIESEHLKRNVLQLTRFDDFIILGDFNFNCALCPGEVIEIVQKNASKTADVIATQLVKGALERNPTFYLPQMTAIVIFLDHKEILLREQQKRKEDVTIAAFLLKDDKSIVELKEKEKITTFKKEEQIFPLEMEDKKGNEIEEDYKVKIHVGETLPNVPQISTISLQETEIGMKSTTKSSNLPSAKVQDESKASSFVVSIEDDDCKSEDLKVSHYITKWIISIDLVEINLLCFFNVEEMQYEFYFEDHESMATIIGLGVLYSKVILECGSSHVMVVEIPKEDWDAMWACSNGILPSIPKGYVLKQERFPHILHHIANVINSDNIISKANNGGVGGDNGKDKAQGIADDSKGKGKGKAHDHDNHGNDGYSDGGSNRPPDDNDKKQGKGNDGNDDKNDGCNQDDGKSSSDCKEVQAVVHLFLMPGGVLEDKEMQKEGEIHKVEVGEMQKEGEVHEVEVGEKKKEGKVYKGVKRKKKHKGSWFALKRGINGNVVGNQQKSTTIRVENGDIENGNVAGNQQRSTTIKGVENGDVDESLKKQLENQIHSQMVFTFKIKDEAGGQLKTIQATINPITFLLPSNNKENYFQRRRFGWFHDYLEVAFGVVDAQVAFLDTNSCKVLDSIEAKEINLQGDAQGNARTHTTETKGEVGLKYFVRANVKHGRTYGSGAQTTEEVKNSWETNETLTKGKFTISKCLDLTSNQLKYSYHPKFSFKEEELIHEDDCLKMYKNPICQLQEVSCEGTWYPDYFYSKNLEAYKLEASRELGMTRICNLEPKTGEEKQQKLVWKAKPLCFIQKLEKVVYLNHAMSHLTSSTIEVYRVRERQDPSTSSTTNLTQLQSKEEPKWPSNDRLVDMRT